MLGYVYTSVFLPLSSGWTRSSRPCLGRPSWYTRHPGRARRTGQSADVSLCTLNIVLVKWSPNLTLLLFSISPSYASGRNRSWWRERREGRAGHDGLSTQFHTRMHTSQATLFMKQWRNMHNKSTPCPVYWEHVRMSSDSQERWWHELIIYSLFKQNPLSVSLAKLLTMS